MARNDIYLNINSLSVADAVVTGQQDMTAATIPELVLGDTPTFNFYFTDNTNVWPSWAGNASYTLTWALSDAVAGDFAPAATTGNATPITGGWSVVLPLNSYDLVGLLNTKRVGQPYPVQNLWQQLRVTDPSGNEITRAMFWTPVRYRAISDTQNTESASPTGGRFVTVNNTNELTTPTAAQFYAANEVPTSALGTAANGELLIGNGTGFTKSTLTAGTGVTITNASGSITIDASGAQETLTATVKNAESVPITKGQVVYLYSATGNMASVKLANNSSDATSAKTFGVVSDTSIAANGTGTVTCVGVVSGLNLGAYNDGDTVYLGASAGTITTTKPYAPNHLVYVGIIERANAGNGELYVKIQNGYELDEIHDVQITSAPLAGALLMRDATNSLWKANRLTAGTNIAVTNADTSVTVGLTGTVAVANGGTGVTTSTGTGSVVLSNTPTLTTPILGTPQSGTLSSCTGLPISTGVSGLGTNVATFLATPSSANLASAVTDETGTGSLVFANTPTLVTPNIGAATGTSVNLSGAGTFGGAIAATGTSTLTAGYWKTKPTADDGTLTGFALSNSGATTIGVFDVNTLTGDIRVGGTNSSYPLALYSKSVAVMTFGASSAATLAGNLTVSGTGTHTFGTTNTVTMAAGVLVTLSSANYTSFGTGFASKIETFAHNYNLLTGLASSGAVIQSRNGLSAGVLQLNPDGGNLLVGTTTDGGQKLQVVGQTSTGFISATDYSNGDAGQFIARGARGTPASPLAQNASDSTGLVRMYGYDGSSFIENARIHAQAVGTIATNRVGGVLSFWTHPDSTSAIAEAMRITQSQNLLIGTTTDGGQKLQVNGNSGFLGHLEIPADKHIYMKQSNPLRWSSDGLSTGSVRADVYADSGGALYLRTNGSNTALTLDSSQRAQFAGNLGLGAGPLSYMGIRNSLSLTASSGVAYVYQSGGTLTTSANNDQIFGMSIDNGYSNTGSYTNISAGHLQINAQSFSGIAFGYGIRIGNITGATNNYAIRTGSGIVSFEDTTASTATNSGALRVSGGVGVAGAINVGTFYGMVDGVTAPSATSGYAKIYVDTADGDLKVIFGDGTIKTIATDS